MKQQTFTLDILDQPDVLVRIMQIIHRRGGHVRTLRVDPEQPWAKVQIVVQGVDNPNHIAHALEKLVDVRRVNIVAS